MKTKKLLKLLEESKIEVNRILNTSSVLKDPNERHKIVQENVINILIQYDELVRDTHKDLILMAENMVKNTPMEFRKREDNEPMKHYRYTTSPAFRRVADMLTAYILTNTK